MTETTARTPTPRLRVRERWEHLRHSDAVKDLLADFTLWTALWSGFPLSKDELARKERSEQ